MLEQEEALRLVGAICRGQFEDASVEVKAAHRQLPKRICETLSALANRPDGGIVVLGLDEEHQFAVVGVLDPQKTIAQLTDVASSMQPALRVEPTVVQVEGKQVVVVEVPECDYRLKPCYYRVAGLSAGSYVRVGNTNRRMTDYELFSFVSGHSQPTFDRESADQATIADLDQEYLQTYLATVRQGRPQLWERLRMSEKTSVEQLCELGILAQEDGERHPTLAGLLCFGKWSQKLFPSLVVTFVRYAGRTSDDKGPRGERFLDNAKFEGNLAGVVEQALRRTLQNVRQSTLVDGIFHRSLPEYPEEAIREAIINAVAHRDYSPMGRGSQIRLEMFADRLEVQSPGGLYGAVTVDNLEEAQSTRNQLLMRFLEELGLVENRGSGIRAMIAAMREARLEPPHYEDTRNYFRVTFKNTSLMSPEAVRWLNRFGSYRLNDNQRMALIYLHWNEKMTNSDYRRLNSVYDTIEATRELRELVGSGLLEMHASRRWAYYTLAGTAREQMEIQAVGSEAERVLDYIYQHGSISRRECAELLRGSLTHSRYILGRMRDQGKLKMVGRKRWARYTLP